MDLSERIRTARNKISATQLEFAEAIGTSQKVVSRWEKGVRPQERMLRRIAGVATVSYEWLALGSGEVDEPANLTADERKLLVFYRGLEGEPFRNELVARFVRARQLVEGLAMLTRRVPRIFHNEDTKDQPEILEYLRWQLQELYGELAGVDGARSEAQEELEAGYGEQEVIDNLNGQVRELEERIRKLERCNREIAIEEIGELVYEDDVVQKLWRRLKGAKPN